MSDISLEELLEKISELEEGGKESPSSPLKEEKKVPKSVTDFIKTWQIKSGEIRVPSYKIFHEYITWDRFHSTKLSKVEFFRQFKKFFESGRGNQGRYYLLDEESFDLSKESLTKAKEYDILHQNKYRKSAKKVKNYQEFKEMNRDKKVKK